MKLTRAFIAMLMAIGAGVSAAPQGVKVSGITGSIEGRVTFPGGIEGISDVIVTLQGPRQTLDSPSLNTLYTPSADLNPEMRRQIAQLVENAGTNVSIEALARTARQLEARLLGLTAPPAIPPAATTGTPVQTPPTTTDRDGRFSFKGLLPGRYTVRVQREADGYFAVPGKGVREVTPAVAVTSVVTVEAGNKTDLDFALMRGGVTAGRLTDPNGRILPDFQIVACRMTYDADGWPASTSPCARNSG